MPKNAGLDGIAWWTEIPSGNPAIHPHHRARGETRFARREIERGGDDLFGSAAALERGRAVELVLLGPRLADIGEEAAGRDRVHPHLGPVLESEGLGDRIERGLGAGIRCDLWPGPQRTRAGDVDDRSALARRHAAA